MIGMQYKIILPSDYDMGIIKTRIKNNGHKTDGFDSLIFKCYLIKEKGVNGFENSYAPLYLWKNNNGINKFLFEGYYDNILKSFGWQSVNIGIPILVQLSENFNTSKYVIEIAKDIAPRITLMDFKDSIEDSMVSNRNCTGKVCIYNPDKWRYSIFYFYSEHMETNENSYRILHISR